jgi:uncharacterized protein
MFDFLVSSKEELREVIGKPSELAMKKVIHYLDEHCCHFISKSPFLVIATSDKHGNTDVSPRGDKAGFTLVLNERFLVIPERIGNKRVDSLYNIIENPRVGLLFFIPGLKETLRVNGKALVIRDEHILKQMEANGKIPLVGVVVEIEECFLQCGKALLRSELWDQTSWLDDSLLPSGAKILSDHANLPDMDEEAVQERLEEGYRNRMY